MIENAAVFVGGQRKFKNVNVDFDESNIVVRNRVTGDEMSRYSVVEVATSGMAWDVSVPSQEGDSRIRLVAQQGCGCTGMHPYALDPAYSGAIPHPARR